MTNTFFIFIPKNFSTNELLIKEARLSQLFKNVFIKYKFVNNFKFIINSNKEAITFGNEIEGFTEIQFFEDCLSILTDEVMSYPLYCYKNEAGFFISNYIEIILSFVKKLDPKEIFTPDEVSCLNFIAAGYFYESTGLSGIIITKPNARLHYNFYTQEIKESRIKKVNNFGTDDFKTLYDALLESIDYVAKNKIFEYIEITGGVDTRLILGALMELGLEKKYTFITNATDSETQNTDASVASLICDTLGLSHKIMQHREFSKNEPAQIALYNNAKTRLNGKYGSEFYSGTFFEVWLEELSKDIRKTETVIPYLDFHVSPLSDLYALFGTNSFVSPVHNLYSNQLSPFKFRLLLLELNRFADGKLSNYQFHNYLFGNKLSYLAKFPFLSNFSKYYPEYKLITKKKNIQYPVQISDFKNPFIKKFFDNFCSTEKSMGYSHRRTIIKLSILDAYLSKHINS